MKFSGLKFVSMVFGVAAILIWASPVFPAESADQFSTRPVTNGGKKWRIGYLEAGTYPNYYKSLIATLEGLMKLGWIERTTLPEQFGPSDTRSLWQWISVNLESRYLRFVNDAFWSQEFNDALRPLIKKKILHRLNELKDIDLMIVMGTKAGLDMANNEHHTPTVIGSTTDAVAAGIIKSADDSGFDHVHAMVDQRLYELQLKKFHEIIHFKTLGIAYRNTAVGRSTAAIDSVEAFAAEMGIDIIACDLNSVIPDTDENERKEEKIVRCHELLAPLVDAVYITRYAGGVTLKNMPNLLKPLIDHRVPTFSQAGPEEVANGVLLSVAMSRFMKIGEFYAETIAKIFNGAKPGELNQRFDQPARIAINIKTASAIGYDPPIEILAAADEIYQEAPWE